MVAITKPVDINKIWSASGDILAPSDTKISQGWVREIPPYQIFNWLDSRQDQTLAYLNQRGIPVWDDQTEYQANGSYVQGSDGVVYKALVTNTNINPVGTTGTWQVAFAGSGDGAKVASAAQSRTQTDNSVFISPLQLANAFTGTNQSLNTGQAYQRLPGGFIIQTGGAVTNASGTITVSLPQGYTNASSYKTILTVQSMTFDTITLNRVSSSINQFVVNSTKNNVATPNVGFDWVTIGY